MPQFTDAVLTVTAAGTVPYTYQWYEENSGYTCQPVPASNGDTLVVCVNETTSRWVRVGNLCGDADSVTAVLTATTSCASASISAHPQSVTSNQERKHS